MAKKKKSTIPRWMKLLVAALGTVTIGGGALAAGNLPYFKGEKVIEVVDGDTFFIENRQTIRLYGLNAPELENCMGQDAKKALSDLILGKRVQLREPIIDRGSNRVMTLVYQNKTLINEVMVRAGLAEFDGHGGSQTERMKSANAYARGNNVGIYSPVCYQLKPPDPDCVIKGNFDGLKDTKIYYTPTCGWYDLVIIEKHQGDDWFCTEAEAREAGFEKSETCE
ncbi:MAG: thermonuclease family protein [Candidatus Gottesmanbacteria bacterium]|nr:thermonuclease family protein [Candidatus Gottesmanbacteria bacterium]